MPPGLGAAQASSLIWQNPKSLRQTPNTRHWSLIAFKVVASIFVPIGHGGKAAAQSVLRLFEGLLFI